MRAVVQRVASARVEVAGRTVSEIGVGLLVLVGVAEDDSSHDAEWLAEKVATLRIFEDDAGKMNLSLKDVGGSLLAVSQFTLLGDCRKGRRPSYERAAPPAKAEPLYAHLVSLLRSKDVLVTCGAFREHMQVSLVADGPVTVLLDSRKLF